MLKYVKGDLFTTTDPVIAHGCNSRRVMGSGVAKIVREKYPAAHDAYQDFIQDTYDSGLHPLGRINPVTVSISPLRIIINAFTQDKFGGGGTRWVSYDAVDTCFRDIGLYMRVNNLKNLSIPKIGAGLGGGDWQIIESIIKTHTDDLQVKIWTID